MQGNRKRDTRPELAIRRAAHQLGLRYRVSARPLPHLNATADLVFPRARVAVFVDGCYWHGCPEHYTPSRTNPSYWGPKIARNQERDSRVTAELSSEGWTVLRFWEHDPADVAANRIAAAVRGAGQ
jgi:DNA mismatch endonuclease, patch repair protein